MSDERTNLGVALLSIASELAAAQHRRAQIEDEEIIYKSEHPLLQTGVSLEYLAELIRQKKVPGNIDVRRALKHPEREQELRAEATRLSARAAELVELEKWIQQELENLKTTEAA